MRNLLNPVLCEETHRTNVELRDWAPGTRTYLFTCDVARAPLTKLVFSSPFVRTRISRSWNTLSGQAPTYRAPCGRLKCAHKKHLSAYTHHCIAQISNPELKERAAALVTGLATVVGLRPDGESNVLLLLNDGLGERAA